MGRSWEEEKRVRNYKTVKEENRETYRDEEAEVHFPIFYWKLGKFFFHLVFKAELFPLSYPLYWREYEKLMKKIREALVHFNIYWESQMDNSKSTMKNTIVSKHNTCFVEQLHGREGETNNILPSRVWSTAQPLALWLWASHISSVGFLFPHLSKNMWVNWPSDVPSYSNSLCSSSQSQ